MTTEKTKFVLEKLEKLYPDAECELNYNSPYELLIATLLSAQCTDIRVNIVTEKLFEKYNTPELMLTLSETELQGYIKTCGLFNTKGKNILKTSKILVDEYNGIVPKEREILETLPGIGRKTANVVISNCFGVPAIAVDTHVQRVAQRIGLSKNEIPLKIEEDLMRRIPKKYWTKVHHQIIWHGRRLCTARSPKCEDCEISEKCVYFRKNKVKLNTK